MARGKSAKNSQTVPSNVDKIADDETVCLVNARYANRKTITSGGEISFDAEGKVRVNGSLAKELLTIKGFELDGKKKYVETESAEQSEVVEKTTEDESTEE